MERLFRSFKTEWLPSVGYMSALEAYRDTGHYRMHRYNWIRPHQFNGGLAGAVTQFVLNSGDMLVPPSSRQLRRHRHTTRRLARKTIHLSIEKARRWRFPQPRFPFIRMGSSPVFDLPCICQARESIE